MTSLKVEQMVAQLEELTPREQQATREAFDRLLEEATLTPLQRWLMEGGLLLNPGNPVKRAEFFKDYQPVRIEGEPVSETLIRERR